MNQKKTDDEGLVPPRFPQRAACCYCVRDFTRIRSSCCRCRYCLMWSWLEAPVIDGPFRAGPVSEEKGSEREGNATRVSPLNEGSSNKGDSFAHIKGTEKKQARNELEAICVCANMWERCRSPEVRRGALCLAKKVSLRRRHLHEQISLGGVSSKGRPTTHRQDPSPPHPCKKVHPGGPF